MGGQTISEKILEKASGRERVAPGDIVEANVDLLYMHEMLAMAILPLNEIGVEKVWDPSKIVVTLDHWVPPPTPEIAEPEAARRHYGRGVRRANPRRECADGADHVRVAVAPNHKVPRMRVPPLRDELMDNAMVSDVMKVLDSLLLAELSDRLVHLRDFRRRRRNPVVEGDG